MGIGNNWRKLYKKVKEYGNNTKHLNRYLQWKDLVQVLSGRKGIDRDLQNSILMELENKKSGEMFFVY